MGDMSIHFCQWCGGTLGGDNPCQCGAAMEIAALRAECAQLRAACKDLADDHEFGATGLVRQDHLKAARAALRELETK